MKREPNNLFEKKLFYYLPILIIGIGILLRLVFYLQNRCLFIDEANVARNIYERSFSGLAKPLSYEQFAPPLFLWVVKCFTLLLGYGEMSYRLYSLICGIAALFLFYNLLKQYAGPGGILYSLAIMAVGFIYVRYSTELKQYMSDVVVTLSLILLALRFDILRVSRLRFFLYWLITGSVAIWLSMPGVFTLLGVGVYYLFIVIKERKFNLLILLALTGAAWTLQFLLYYNMVLKAQIHSDYLQNWHKENFLFPLPGNWYEIKYNLHELKEMLVSAGGQWTLSLIFHTATLLLGIYCLLKENMVRAMLLLIPIIGLLLASALHEYALTARIILFIMPIMLVFIAVGVQTLTELKSRPLQIMLPVIAAICIINFGAFNLFLKRIEYEDTVASLKFLKKDNVTGDHLLVHNIAGPAYLYYTTIHPKKARWTTLANAYILHWDTNYDSLARTLNGKSALLYSWVPDEELANERTAIQKYRKEIAENKASGSTVFIYQ